MRLRSHPRLARSLTSTAAAVMALLLASQTVLAAVSWTPPVGAGPTGSWNLSPSLARTVAANGTAYLHTVYTSDKVGSTWVTDTGPYAGVYYRRVSATSTTFGTAQRLNPSDAHGVNGVLAAAGTWVYAVWLHMDHYVTPVPAEDRTIHFRANGSHGSSSAWTSITDLTTTGRAARVSIAATGDYVYVAWTDADSGKIMLAISPDHGASWLPFVTVGTTDRPADDYGYAAGATVAGAGVNVAVAWLMDGDTVHAVVSTDHGTTFGADKTLSPGPDGNLSAAASGGRIALAYSNESGVAVRVWSNGTWGRARGVAGFDMGATYKHPGFGTSVALYGTNGLAVAWAACRRWDCLAGSKTGVDVRWRESTTNGTSWKSPVTVASYGAASARRINNAPSIVMPSATKRYIVYFTAAASYSTYRVMYERGTGTP